MRRVIGFDSWTRGAHHFERLVPALHGRDIGITLVHLGSWGADSGRPEIERLGALEVRDVAAYGSKGLPAILDAEQPDAVIFLSCHTFAHRAFNRYCKVRAIPTLLLYHGLVSVQATGEPGFGLQTRRGAYLRFAMSRIGKTLRHALPCYAGALWRTHGRWREWWAFGVEIARKLTGHRGVLRAPSDGVTSAYAVYTAADLPYAVQHDGARPGQVRVVGNPDLGRFGLTHEMLGSRVADSETGLRDVMYLDTALAKVGMAFGSDSEYLDHIEETARRLGRDGYRLLFKPHPAQDHEALRARLGQAGIQSVANGEFLAALARCTACITEPTTLAVLPALLGMPVMLAGYGRLAGIKYGSVLLSYPRARMLHDLGRFAEAVIAAREAGSPSAVRGWIAENAGPLPAEDMPERVAALLDELIPPGARAGKANPSSADGRIADDSLGPERHAAT